jgi:large repetitive protein
MANPYAVGSPASGSGSFTLSITVTTATAAGDKIEVAAVAANGLVTGVTDSRGNSYVQTDGDSTGAGTALFHYIADGATTALQVGDTITVSYTLSWALKIAIAIATSGLAATALDKHNIATNAGSPSPSVTSAALAQASETVIGVIGDNFTSSGGDPVWAAGWTKIISGSVTGYPHVSFAYKQVNSTSAVTANGTISSSKWTAIISSLKNSATVTVTSPSLPNGTVGIPYSAPNETAAGGTQSYTWAKTTGTLPPGVSISSAGVWSGIPTTPGTFS